MVAGEVNITGESCWLERSGVSQFEVSVVPGGVSSWRDTKRHCRPGARCRRCGARIVSIGSDARSAMHQRPLCAFRPSVRSSFSSPDLILILRRLRSPQLIRLISFLSLTHAPSHNVVNATCRFLMFNRRHHLLTTTIFKLPPTPPSRRP